jgi:hypothetical protein
MLPNVGKINIYIKTWCMLPYVDKVNMHQDVVYVVCSGFVVFSSIKNRGRRGCHRMVVGFTTTCVINDITTEVVTWNTLMTRCTRYNIMSVTCDRSVVFTGYSGFLHQ